MAERRRGRGDEPSASLGSLSQPGRSRRRCGACGGDDLTELAMTLADGTRVTFVSCQECEQRRWLDAEDREIPVEEVLARSRRR